VWDKGYLVSREIELFQEGVPNVKLYDKSGQKVRESSIWFPGAQRVIISSAAVTPDGRIIASGDAEKADGTTATFIALTNLAGKVTQVIQTKGYYPSHVCEAPDGTVWSFGGTGYDEQTYRPNPGDTLRHFDFHKGQIASYLPRSLFPDRPAPDKPGFIRCSKNEVVAYSPSTQEFIEIDYGGVSLRTYRAESPSGLSLVGFASNESKSVYAYFSRLSKADEVEGLYYLSFNELGKTVHWTPLEGAVGLRTKPGAVIDLWGTDGDSLVISRSEDTIGRLAIHWATLIR
jgi:hypothetical protein